MLCSSSVGSLAPWVFQLCGCYIKLALQQMIDSTLSHDFKTVADWQYNIQNHEGLYLLHSYIGSVTQQLISAEEVGLGYIPDQQRQHLHGSVDRELDESGCHEGGYCSPRPSPVSAQLESYPLQLGYTPGSGPNITLILLRVVHPDNIDISQNIIAICSLLN